MYREHGNYNQFTYKQEESFKICVKIKKIYLKLFLQWLEIDIFLIKLLYIQIVISFRIKQYMQIINWLSSSKV